MSCQHLNYPTFLQSLARGRPIVVTGVHHRLQGTWTPKYFVDRFGSQEVTLVDCKTDTEFSSTVANFFQHFGAAEDRRVVKLKVQRQAIARSTG